MKNKIKIVKINDLNVLHSDTECSEYYGNGFEINQDVMLINGRPFDIAYAGYYYTDEGVDRVDGETILDAVIRWQSENSNTELFSTLLINTRYCTGYSNPIEMLDR